MRKEPRRRPDGFYYAGLNRHGDRTYEHWLSPEAWARKQAKRGEVAIRFREKRAADPVRHAAINEYSNAYTKRWRVLNPEREIFLRARRRAKATGVPFSLTMADIVIPVRCPVFGLILTLGGQDNAPELDRIVNANGYVPGNVIVISRRANRIKNDATLAELQRLAAFYGSL